MIQEINSQEYQDSSEIQIIKKEAKCVVCRKISKYICPRCKVNYCGIQHYRSHNLFCSQQFYKQQVERTLKNMKSTPQQRKSMKQILKRQNEEPQYIPDDRFVDRYQEMLQRIQNGEDIKLTHLEEVDFCDFIQKWTLEEGTKQFWQIQQGLSNYLLMNQQDNQLQNNNEQNKRFVDYRRGIKSVLQTIPKFQILCKKPSQFLIYHLISIVYAGALLLRYFDSDIITDKKQSESYLLKICPLLQKRYDVENVKSCLLLVQDSGIRVEKQLKAWLFLGLLDIQKILKNKYLILQMLYRLGDILSNKIVEKKIQFFKSFIKWSLNDDLLKRINQQIRIQINEHQKMKQECQMIEKIKRFRKI